ncbi:hypothetical protein PRIPAC_71512 [Pristionchus pacificus]|uniref:Uncharacterized protein n=1 Tax=Pristionchus pacificus TaxID=54126 RepID=A0A2A6C0F6_PRIPA|nr:hypothetical protein PRIPAC_71512 [Pristionchus pacificus]|eukprot:PDM71511.1 hypothetical protein PRIPAC_37918 [Pristionchus pacificus]
MYSDRNLVVVCFPLFRIFFISPLIPRSSFRSARSTGRLSRFSREKSIVDRYSSRPTVMPLVDQSMRSLFTGEMTKEEAPLVFLYVFLTTTALIMLVYFCSLIIFHCVFWPKILAKIKADKPKETAKQEQILHQLSDSPVVERTPPSDKELFRGAHSVVSENASLIGDKTPRSAITCAATVTAAPAPSPPPQLGVQTAKENRKARKWYEDDMMTTGMELSQSKDHRKGKKRSEDMRTGREEKDYHLRTGREKKEEKKKEGGRTIKRLRFASASERKSDEPPLQQLPKKNSQDGRTKRRVKDLPPASFYAYEIDPTQREGRGTERKRSRENVAGTAGTRTANSIDNRSTDRPEKPQLLELCKTQED